MVDALTKYRQALQTFATPGGRWSGKGAFSYWGKAAAQKSNAEIAEVVLDVLKSNGMQKSKGTLVVMTQDECQRRWGGARLNTPDGAPFMSRKLGCASKLRNLRNIPQRNFRIIGKGVRR